MKDYIAAGDIYQANLSFRARFAFAGEPRALCTNSLWRKAARPIAPSWMMAGGRSSACRRNCSSICPADGRIDGAADEGHRTARAATMTEPSARGLAASAKDRAENLMIVDLIRNDLSRIAEPGSVEVSDLFKVETYPTLHAMVSTVTARKRADAGVADILRALFPCGSVTGAPKIRAMEILRELESSPRGAYCGAIGHFAPDGSARFNVAIRTLTVWGDQGELGIGGGVVQDSRVRQRICRMPAQGAVLRSVAPAAGTDRDLALG